MLAGSSRPQVEVDGTIYFLQVTIPHLDPGARRVEARQLSVFVDGNFVVTSCRHPLPFEGRVFVRASQNPELMRADSAYLVFIVLDELLQHFEHLQDVVQQDIEDLEERALRGVVSTSVRWSP